MSLRIFLSTVSPEFRAYRDQLRTDLDRQNVDVKVQEVFKDLGGTTLEKLDAYVVEASAVVHLVGDMPGAYPSESDQAALLSKYPDLTNKLPALGEALRAGPISYTQWEAWLALYHDKPLFIAQAEEAAPRGKAFAPTPEGRAAQLAHLGWLRKASRYPGFTFTSPDNLAKQLLAGGILDELAKVHGKRRRPQNLPYASLGPLFKGREGFLAQLHEALSRTAPGQAAAVVGKAVHGLGGVGKTRLAVEYAYRHEAEYSATLFVRADTPELLTSSLAVLAGPDILDLPEKDAAEDRMKVNAALGWLENHPGWLIILDNVDDERAAEAVQKLLARLRGGRVLITGRLSKFPGAVKKLELNVLPTEDAAAFLLERTEGDRKETPDDAALAMTLATELGGLALGLEQAGAYIATEHIGFVRYLDLWREKRATVLEWFDKDLMEYDHDTGLAATWATSVDRLKPDSRQLLDRLAFFAPEPIPDTLLDVQSEGGTVKIDPRVSISGLYAYSLVSRAQVETTTKSVSGFVVHRLVQDFTRRTITEERIRTATWEATYWISPIFTVDGTDVRAWPRLDPLINHAVTLALFNEKSGYGENAARLLGRLGVLFLAKGRYREAEQVFLSSLRITEKLYGSTHHLMAVRLQNLASLLRETRRFAEAESMYRRSLAIDEACTGSEDHEPAATFDGLGQLFVAMGRLDEAEPLLRKALAITEKQFGPVAIEVSNRLNSLAELLREKKEFKLAEPVYVRALKIVEKLYGSFHPNVAVILNNLSLLLIATRRYDLAEGMLQYALKIDEASYGADHPAVGTDLANLAVVMQLTNRLENAETTLRRALAIFERSYGPSSFDVAIRLSILADFVRMDRRLDEARLLYHQALKILRANYGPDHPDTVRVQNNLAGLRE